MSRSSEGARRLTTAAVLAVGFGLVGLALEGDMALAAPNGSPVAHAPVEQVVTPVLDVEDSTADLLGEAPVTDTSQGTRVRLDSTLLFGKDSAVLRPSAGRRLDQVAATIRAKGPGQVTVTGYTDDLGSASHGLGLSRRRASAVATYLRQWLPQPDFRFWVAGRGEAEPAAPNTSEVNRRKNRRVLLVYEKR